MPSHHPPTRALLAALLIAAAGCDTSGLLDIDDPDLIERPDLITRQGAEALYRGALTQLAIAKDGGASATLGIAELGGLFADEFIFAATPPDLMAADLRRLGEDNSPWAGPYYALHAAREAAAEAAEALDLTAPGDARIAELLALEAATIVLLAEHYCGAVPLSSTRPEIRYGEPLDTDGLFQAALERLDRAGAAGAAGDVARLAAVLRGRALLGLARHDEAAAAVAGVPTAFEYLVRHSTATEPQMNQLYVGNWEFDRFAVADAEAGVGLPFARALDPRLVVIDAGLSRADGETRMLRWAYLESRATSTILANGVEARLIEAEAAARAGRMGDVAAAVDAARAGSALPPAPVPATEREAIDLVFRERGFALFGTAHRLGDLRRLVREYGREPAGVYPSGPYHKLGLTYGEQLSLPIPRGERNNPLYGGCDAEAS